MFEKMEIFRMAQGLATHAAARQVAIARNVANADTPGYRAQDIAPFSETYRARDAQGLRATRPGHILPGEAEAPQWRVSDADRPGTLKPNGNNVSLETETMLAAEVRGQHELALSVYRSALGIMRTSLGRR